MAGDGAEVTLIGCPGCTGVLTAVSEGARGHTNYVCTVGHAYSLQSLLEAKEGQLETGLWSVLAVLQHLDIAYCRLLARIDAGEQSYERGSVSNRLSQLASLLARVREVIHADGPAPLGQPTPAAGRASDAGAG